MAQNVVGPCHWQWKPERAVGPGLRVESQPGFVLLDRSEKLWTVMTEERAEHDLPKGPKLLWSIGGSWKQLVDRFVAASVESRCYIVGVAIVFTAVLLLPWSEFDSAIVGRFGAAVFGMGLLPALSRVYAAAWKNCLGKLAISASVALGTNYA